MLLLLLLGLNWLAAVAVLPLFWYLISALTIASVLAGLGVVKFADTWSRLRSPPGATMR